MKNPTKPQAACEFFLILTAVYFWKQHFEDLIELKLGTNIKNET